jgi:phosphate transport system substrate-binding protein
MNNLMTFWAEQLGQHHPDLRIDIEGKGSSTAFPALIAGTAQIGPMVRPANEDELQRWWQAKSYPPTEVIIAADVLGVVVPKTNPIDHLTLAELDALFGADRRRGHPPLTRWTDLVRPGLALPDEPIFPVVMNPASISYGFIRQLVLEGGDFRADTVVQPGGAGVMHSVLTRPGGIGFVTAWRIPAQHQARAVPVAKDEHSPALPHLPCDPTAYPLTRLWFVYLDLPPGKPLDPALAEILRFILSREGQAEVARELVVPLPELWCAAQRSWLGL